MGREKSRQATAALGAGGARPRAWGQPSRSPPRGVAERGRRGIRVSLDEACKVSQRPGEREVEIASDHGEGCRLRHAGPWARVLIKYTNFFDALVNGDSGKEVWARRECIHDPAP